MPAEKIVQVRGHRIHYIEAGTGESLLLLHGLGGSRLAFSANVRALSAVAHVVVLDQIGFGRSDKPDLPYAIETFVEHLIGFMQELRIARAVLGGNSMGGEVALRLALARPEMVSGLVLVACGGLRGEASADEEAAADPDPGEASGTRAYLESLFFDRDLVTEDLVRLAIDNRRAYGDGDTIHRFQAARAASGWLDEATLSSIRVPALLVWGREDRLTPLSSGERLHGAIPGSRLVVLEGCGHLPQIERAYDFNRAVLEFLRRPR